MTDREPYRYILIELEKPLDLGSPRKLAMLCPTPEDVGLTFVSGDEAARAVRFTPFRHKRPLPEPDVLLAAIRARDEAVTAYWCSGDDPPAGPSEDDVDATRDAIFALVYGEDYAR